MNPPPSRSAARSSDATAHATAPSTAVAPHTVSPPMISLGLARQLRDAGLRWSPGEGDRFIVPDRGMDDRVFTVSEMPVDVREAAGGTIIAFNGTVEWALDSINQWEVVWLPREAQLREALGDHFRGLTLRDGSYRCEYVLEGATRTTRHGAAAEAYGRALLEVVKARTRAELEMIGARRAS